MNTMTTVKLYKNDIIEETRMIPAVTQGENLTYHADFHFNNIKLSDSGIYKCEGLLMMILIHPLSFQVMLLKTT